MLIACRPFFVPFAALLTAGLALCAAPAAEATDDLVQSLAVRVGDARGVAGGEVVIVLRTYSSRAVKQGRLTVRTTKKAAVVATAAATTTPSPFAVCGEPIVFSVGGDATQSGAFDPIGQSFAMDFASASATINAADGVLAAFTCTLDDALVAGDRYVLDLSPDVADSILLDPSSAGISILPKPGELRILDKAESGLGIDDLSVKPGAVAVIEVGTDSAYPIESGQVEIAYDATVASGNPGVVAEGRHGSVTLGAVSYPAPGRVRFQFTSSGADFNTIPGTLFRVSLPTKGGASLVGTTRALSIVAASTHLEGPLGVPIAVSLENGVLTFSAGAAESAIFRDGFGTGTTASWSLARP